MGNRLTRVLTIGGVLLLLVLAFGYGVGVGVYHWPPFSAMRKLKASVEGVAPDKSQIAETAVEIAALVRSQAGDSKRAQVRFAREFVFSNSLHRLDGEHERYAWDTDAVLVMLRDHYRTHQDPPHLSCGPRALALKAVLDALEIESRLVHIFTGDYEEVRSHTFLEVYDAGSSRWGIEDPGNDVTYVDAATDEPVSLVRAVLGGVQSVVPVSRRGRGWELNEIDYLQAHYFQAAKYDSADGIPDIIVINTDRFPVTKRFPANGHTTFAEFSRKMYRNPVFFLNNAIPSFAGSLNRQTRTNRPSRCGS